MPKIRDYDSQNLCNILNALGKLDHYEKGLVNSLCSSAINKINEFSSQGIANTLNALSKLNYYDKRLLDALISAAKNKTREFNSHDISLSLNALGKFNNYEKGLVDAFCSAVMKKSRELNYQSICNAVYALSIFALYREDMWFFLFDELSNLLKEGVNSMSVADCSQIHIGLLALSLENPSLSSKLRYPDALKDKCSAAHLQDMSSSANKLYSTLHLDVSKALKEMSISHENETVASGFLSVDIFIKPDMSQQNDGDHKGVIIEVDGPSHFLRCGNGSEMVGKRSTKTKGESLLKDRLLEKQGYKVLHIPYYEWDELTTPETKKNYLSSVMSPFKDISDK